MISGNDPLYVQKQASKKSQLGLRNGVFKLTPAPQIMP